ncbi:MAG: hypothetical protein IJ004_04590 [Clostridia bacterium]|nr:hypothetical protein [Clostridia bacterium]
MKIDKKTIDLLLKLNDDQLWSAISHVAKKSGSSTFSNMERPKDMSKIRALLSSLTDEQINQAIRAFKESKKND